MKVLLVNPAFHNTFYSYHKVVKLAGWKAIGPPLGLITVASLLPKEWDLKLVDLNFAKIKDRDWEERDLVMVTGTALQDRQIAMVIRDAKKKGKVVVVGGPWAFHSPKDALSAGADLVVRGEAELTMSAMLEKLRGKRFGEVISVDGKADLENVPSARFDLLDTNSYWSLTIQFSRGCPYECEYCDITHMYGRRFRSKTPHQILKELDIIYRLGWRGTIFFVDDSFTGIPSRTKALLKELIPWMNSRGRPFEFRTQTVAGLAEDDELLDLLVRAGFVSVYVGIDSTDVGTLNHTKKFHHASMDLDTACRKINRAGIAVFAGFMIGFDDESPGVDRRVIDFVMRNQIPEVLVSALMALPGTALWTRLEKEGRLFPDSTDLCKPNRLLNFVAKRPVEEIAREMTNIYQVVYEPESFLKRGYEHIRRMPRLHSRNFRRHLNFRALLGLIVVLFTQGVRYPSRWRYWSLFLKTVVKRRDRLGLFLYYSIFLRKFFDFRSTGINASRQDQKN